MMQPRFWYRDAGLESAILGPLAMIWSACAARRIRRGPYRSVDIPVICIGNLTIGGTGKTPLAIALAQRLATLNQNPHFISRGYGGTRKGPLLVDSRRHNAVKVGDEPLLLSAFGPTWVARDRMAGATAAVQSGATAIILDDGLQNPAIKSDLAIVVVDADRGFGNGRVIPAGPLREKIDAGLNRADVVVAVGSRESRRAFRGSWQERIQLPVVGAELLPLKTGVNWAGMRVLAFAGIGFPDKFFETLRRSGADIVETVALTDHQALPDSLLHRLESRARSLGAQLVTTEKDVVRMSRAWQERVSPFPVRMQLEDSEQIDHLVGKLFPVERRDGNDSMR